MIHNLGSIMTRVQKHVQNIYYFSYEIKKKIDWTRKPQNNSYL